MPLQFTFFGNGNWHAGIKGNHVKGRQSGINCVRFSDGTTIHYELPGIIVKGVGCFSRPPYAERCRGRRTALICAYESFHHSPPRV